MRSRFCKQWLRQRSEEVRAGVVVVLSLTSRCTTVASMSRHLPDHGPPIGLGICGSFSGRGTTRRVASRDGLVLPLISRGWHSSGDKNEVLSLDSLNSAKFAFRFEADTASARIVCTKHTQIPNGRWVVLGLWLIAVRRLLHFDQKRSTSTTAWAKACGASWGRL
jgi:hypothetical protein